MKQGSASREVSRSKQEPKAHAIGRAAVADLGTIQQRTRSVQLYEGRGYEAPMNGCSRHKSGSQGKH